MARCHTNKPSVCDECRGGFAVEGTSEFSTSRLFKSHQDLMDWVQNTGRSLGYVVITKRSNARPCGYIYKVRLICDRGGVHTSKSSFRNATTKKINCPFELEGRYSCKYDCWKLRVICEKHNHEPALNMEGHPYSMRLSKDEARLVLDLSKKNVKPQAILALLKEQNENNTSTMRTIYNALHKFRKGGHLDKSKGKPTTGEEIASMSPKKKSKRAINHAYQFGLLNKCKEKTCMEQPIDNVKSVYANPMCTGHAFDVNKSKRTVDHSDPNTFETKTFMEKPINHEDRASLNPMYTGYAFDVNKSTRTIDYINPFSVPNSCEIKTFMGQPIKCEEGASLSPVHTAYTFDADTSKRTVDHMDQFAIENWAQELDSTKCGSIIQDIEDHMLREQMLMPSFRRVPSPQTDLMEIIPVRNISNANLVRDVVMCDDGKSHDTSAPTFARPFQPYRDMILSTPDGQFLMKQFLEEDYAHGQSSTRNSRGEGEEEGAEKNRMNTAFESIVKEDRHMNVDDDVKVEKEQDNGEYVAVQFDSKQMASSLPNKSTQGDENVRNLEVEGTSGFSTNRMFKSCQDLMDWVQTMGCSLGYVIITRRSNSQPSGDVYKVTLICDRGGIYKNKSSIRRNTRSKKTNCPFELEGRFSKRHGFWTLRVMCEQHNHEPAHMEGHSFAKRLSEDEIRLVLDLSKKNVRPQEILSTLKAQNKNNVSTLKTIYNVRQKFRRTGHAEISTGLPMDGVESASPTPVYTGYTFDANKSETTVGHTYASEAFMEQLINTVDSASTNPMCSAKAFDISKPNKTLDQMDPFAISNTCEIKTTVGHTDASEAFMEQLINTVDSASTNLMCSAKAFDISKPNKTVDQMDPFAISNTCEIKTTVGHTDASEAFMEQLINTVDSASTNPLCSAKAYDISKPNKTVDQMDPFAISNTCEIKTTVGHTYASEAFREQLINTVDSASTNPMCSAKAFDISKPNKTVDQMDPFAISNTCEIKTFIEQPINNEESASWNPMYTAYAFDANKLTRSVDYMDPFAIPNSYEIKTFMEQTIKREEGASPSALYTAYGFDSEKSKRTIIDHMDSFAIENWDRELGSAKYMI